MIETDQYKPHGDSRVGFPQICIRTNRTEERTDVAPIIEKAIEVGKEFPFDEPYKIIGAICEVLGGEFGSGSFGHAWIIYFHNKDKYTTYAFHQNRGFVKNSQFEETNDAPERRFHLERCIKVSENNINPDIIEREIIPALIAESNELSQLMKLTDQDLPAGVYTPVTNCSWFAGKLWNEMTKLVYEQPIDDMVDIDYYAERLGLPFLKKIRAIGDPGMLAEHIKKDNISAL
ncbi:hypothetical protein ACGVWS_05900 [Enterobacteriaceae bacterium LUAb1]